MWSSCAWSRASEHLRLPSEAGPKAGANSPFLARPRGVVAQAQPSDATSSPVRTALEQLNRDIDYLEDRTGLDIRTPLTTVADVHDSVVSVLNPLASEAMCSTLEERIAGLQQELAVAHEQVHAQEARLSETLNGLTEIERALNVSTGGLISGTSPSTSDGTRSVTPANSERRRDRGLDASPSLELSPQLENFWYPVEFSSRVDSSTMIPLELFGHSWVLFRDASGQAACVQDECAHRACPLSLGSVVDGQLQCAYHGWRFDGSGACTAMPSTAFCKGIKVASLPIEEADGLIWVFPGAYNKGRAIHDDNYEEGRGLYVQPYGEECIVPQPPSGASSLSPPPGYAVHAELVMEVPVEHGLLLENLLDLAHAPFTHTSTFAKGWPIPDVVRFRAAEVLSGSWHPYPIDMAFRPPCVVLSTIGLTQPGSIRRGATAGQCDNHLHQMHVVLPSRPGHTRLLYRMSMDFMGWARWVPGITKLWESVATQVLSEDLVLVRGQQERLMAGGDVWKNPVPYDKLGVRYRRWRNAVCAGKADEAAKAAPKMQNMSAAELMYGSLDAVDDATDSDEGASYQE